MEQSIEECLAALDDELLAAARDDFDTLFMPRLKDAPDDIINMIYGFFTMGYVCGQLAAFKEENARQRAIFGKSNRNMN